MILICEVFVVLAILFWMRSGIFSSSVILRVDRGTGMKVKGAFVRETHMILICEKSVRY